LITRRCDDAHLGGLWEFPGGKREPEETFEQCLVRELREELGIEIAVEGLVESLTHAYLEKTVHLKFYKCRWLRNEPRLLGCAAFKWVFRDALDAHDFPAADARLVEKLRAQPPSAKDSFPFLCSSPVKGEVQMLVWTGTAYCLE
jgi:mutator protein MutT